MKIETWPLVLVILNALAFAGVVFVNGLANALPINGRTTGALSDLYPNLFVPAGFTFSIWGVIYVLLLLFAGFAVVAVVRAVPPAVEAVRAIDLFFLLSCLANAGWVFTWHYRRVGLSLVVMLVLLGSLLAIYFRLGIGIGSPNRTVAAFVHVPFSVYLGWITVATVANATALLIDLGWNGLGLPESAWAILLVIIAAVIALLAIVRRGDDAFALVVVWALAGIAAKRLEPFADGRAVGYVAVAAALFLVGALLFHLVRRYVF